MPLNKFSWLGTQYGGSKKRRNLYSDYKAGRVPTKRDNREEADKQMLMLRDYLDLLGVNQRKVTGLEADDIVGQICKHYRKEEKIIVSSDKDFMQLVSDNTKMYSLTKKKLFRHS